MTTTSLDLAPARAPTPTALAVAAVAPGLLLALVGGAVVVGSGRLPEGVAPYVVAGCTAAAVTGAIGSAFKARAVSRDGTDSQAGQRLQIAIFADFVLQLFAVGGSMLGMYLSGVKFPSLVGFALAFAGVAVGHLFGSSLVLARALRRRAGNGPAVAASPVAAPPAPASSPSGSSRR